MSSEPLACEAERVPRHQIRPGLEVLEPVGQVHAARVTLGRQILHRLLHVALDRVHRRVAVGLPLAVDHVRVELVDLGADPPRDAQDLRQVAAVPRLELRVRHVLGGMGEDEVDRLRDVRAHQASSASMGQPKRGYSHGSPASLARSRSRRIEISDATSTLFRPPHSDQAYSTVIAPSYPTAASASTNASKSTVLSLIGACRRSLAAPRAWTWRVYGRSGATSASPWPSAVKWAPSSVSPRPGASSQRASASAGVAQTPPRCGSIEKRSPCSRAYAARAPSSVAARSSDAWCSWAGQSAPGSIVRPPAPRRAAKSTMSSNRARPLARSAASGWLAAMTVKSVQGMTKTSEHGRPRSRPRSAISPAQRPTSSRTSCGVICERLPNSIRSWASNPRPAISSIATSCGRSGNESLV